MDSIYPAETRFQWLAVGKTVTDFKFPEKTKNILINCVARGFH
jgi:hypothetical protein